MPVEQPRSVQLAVRLLAAACFLESVRRPLAGNFMYSCSQMLLLHRRVPLTQWHSGRGERSAPFAGMLLTPNDERERACAAHVDATDDRWVQVARISLPKGVYHFSALHKIPVDRGVQSSGLNIEWERRERKARFGGKCHLMGSKGMHSVVKRVTFSPCAGLWGARKLNPPKVCVWQSLLEPSASEAPHVCRLALRDQTARAASPRCMHSPSRPGYP